MNLQDVTFRLGYYQFNVKGVASAMFVRDPIKVSDDTVRFNYVSLDALNDSNGLSYIEACSIISAEQVSESRIEFLREIGRRNMRTVDINSAVQVHNATTNGIKVGLITEPPKIAQHNKREDAEPQPVEQPVYDFSQDAPVPAEVIPQCVTATDDTVISIPLE